jgi:hypothetical protein
MQGKFLATPRREGLGVGDEGREKMRDKGLGTMCEKNGEKIIGEKQMGYR